MEVDLYVIPMAGLSSRFTKAGYSKPKYMLDVIDKPLFDWAVSSFSDYFGDEEFTFIFRDVLGTTDFLNERVNAMGIKNANFVCLEGETRGQADTVALGLKEVRAEDNRAVTIFNIDSFYRNYSFADFDSDGFLDVFVGEGDGWSFVEPECEGRVKRLAEKQRISPLCCTGLYHFNTISLFIDAFEQELVERQCSELYIAPIYNHLIKSGSVINYRLVENDSIEFLGTPQEYEDFLENNQS